MRRRRRAGRGVPNRDGGFASETSHHALASARSQPPGVPRDADQSEARAFSPRGADIGGSRCCSTSNRVRVGLSALFGREHGDRRRITLTAGPSEHIPGDREQGRLRRARRHCSSGGASEGENATKFFPRRRKERDTRVLRGRAPKKRWYTEPQIAARKDRERASTGISGRVGLLAIQ